MLDYCQARFLKINPSENAPLAGDCERTTAASGGSRALRTATKSQASIPLAPILYLVYD
jgi:hypothetical protein